MAAASCPVGMPIDKNSNATSGFPCAAYSARTQRSLGFPEMAIRVRTVSSLTGAPVLYATGWTGTGCGTVTGAFVG